MRYYIELNKSQLKEDRWLGFNLRLLIFRKNKLSTWDSRSVTRCIFRLTFLSKRFNCFSEPHRAITSKVSSNWCTWGQKGINYARSKTSILVLRGALTKLTTQMRALIFQKKISFLIQKNQYVVEGSEISLLRQRGF